MFSQIYDISWWVRFIPKCVFHCSLWFESSWTKCNTFNKSMLVWAWPPEVFFGSLFSVCLGCCLGVSCPLWFCFNNLIWFLRSSIYLSLLFDVSFVLEVTLFIEGALVDNFLWQGYVWAGYSNSSFFQRVGGSSWMFVLLVFLLFVFQVFGSTMLMFIVTAFT